MTKPEKLKWIADELAKTVVENPTSADYFRQAFFQIMLPQVQDSNGNPINPVMDNLIRKYCQLSGVTEPEGISPTIA